VSHADACARVYQNKMPLRVHHNQKSEVHEYPKTYYMVLWLGSGFWWKNLIEGVRQVDTSAATTAQTSDLSPTRPYTMEFFDYLVDEPKHWFLWCGCLARIVLVKLSLQIGKPMQISVRTAFSRCAFTSMTLRKSCPDLKVDDHTRMFSCKPAVQFMHQLQPPSAVHAPPDLLTSSELRQSCGD
jgi:hypothetical protein